MVRHALAIIAWMSALIAHAAPEAAPRVTAQAAGLSARFDPYHDEAPSARPADRQSARPTIVMLGVFGGTVHPTFEFPGASGAVVGLEASLTRELRRGAFAVRATIAPSLTTAAHVEGGFCRTRCPSTWWNWSHGRALIGLDARPAPDRAGWLSGSYGLGVDVARTEHFGSPDATIRVVLTPAHAFTLGFTRRPWSDRPTRFTLGVHHGAGGFGWGARSREEARDRDPRPQVTPTFWLVVGVTTAISRS